LCRAVGRVSTLVAELEPEPPPLLTVIDLHGGCEHAAGFGIEAALDAAIGEGSQPGRPRVRIGLRSSSFWVGKVRSASPLCSSTVQRNERAAAPLAQPEPGSVSPSGHPSAKGSRTFANAGGTAIAPLRGHSPTDELDNKT
jgi:hypothetical protein